MKDKIQKWDQFINENITKSNQKLDSNTVPVTNNPNILKWMVNCQTSSYKLNQKNLSQTLLEELEIIFGKPNKSLRLEFQTKVWILQYKELTFNVFSAKRKGTSIEICGYEYEDIRNGTKEKEIIEFLEELHKLVNQ